METVLNLAKHNVLINGKCTIDTDIMNVKIILNLVTSYFNMQLAHCSYSRQISIPKFTLFIAKKCYWKCWKCLFKFNSEF